MDKNFKFRAGRFGVNTVVMINHEGDAKDISSLIHSVKIEESLESPYLLSNITIRDESNFFELFELCGNEVVELNLFQDSSDGNRTEINLVFYVVGFPSFQKSGRSQMTSYTITCVSEIKYRSDLKKVSRFYESSLGKEIYKIFKNDLGRDVSFFSEKGLEKDPKFSPKVHGVMNWDTPLNHVNSFLGMMYDQDRSPFFLWQNLHDVIELSSYTSLLDDKTHPKYLSYIDTVFRSSPFDDEDLNEIENQMIIKSISTSLGMNRIQMAKMGAYSSDNNSFDLSNKTIKENSFRYGDFHKHEGNFLNSKDNNYDFGTPENGKSFQDLPKVRQNFFYIDGGSFNGGKNLPVSDFESAPQLDSWRANMDTLKLTILLEGDLYLNPGRRISLTLPKSSNPGNYREYAKGESGNNDIHDRGFSRDYLISNTHHVFKFEDFTYETTVDVVSDSIKPV
jgi:hypothetical protein